MVCFVSGIDTGVGKTVATGLMARYFVSRGVDAITIKMVQTGNDNFSEDLAAHRAICGGATFPEDAAGLTAPQMFKFPASPHLAAKLEGRTVDLDAIASAVDRCAAAHEVVLVESAGGLAVPLTDEVLSADFAASCGWPLVLVASARLGSVNHSILSLEVARARGMEVLGVVFNEFPEVDPVLAADFPETMLRYLRTMGLPPNVVRMPRVPEGGPYPEVDFSPMFQNAMKL